MASEVVNDICRWASENVVSSSFSLPTINFEHGQSKKSVSVDDLGDWKSKFAGTKDIFLVW